MQFSLPDVELSIRVGKKRIRLSPKGIEQVPYLSIRELMAVLYYLSAMRNSFYWWIGDLFAASNQYHNVPFAFAKALLRNIPSSAMNIVVAIKAAKIVPLQHRRTDLSLWKHWAIWLVGNSQAAILLTKKAAEERMTLPQIVEEKNEFKEAPIPYLLRKRLERIKELENKKDA